MAELVETATAVAKCHGCGCFQDSVATLERTELAAELSATLERARASFGARTYDCLGCQECWPADALNAASGLVELPTSAGCPTDIPSRREGWPPYPGAYEMLRYAAPVAVCTLHSNELVDAVASEAPDGLSIVGSLQTENLGIERIIENVATNPNIRTLLVCGEDTAARFGHFPGQSLVALVANGIDERGRIVDARGKRPVLRNVPLESITRFRDQISVVDHRGETRPDVVAGLVEDAAASAAEPMASAATAERLVRVLRARPPEQLVLDPAGYVVVIPDRRKRILVAEHYDNEGVLRAVVEGEDANHIIATLLGEGLVTRLDHAAYLGRELALAERALREDLPYVQDQAPEGIRDASSGGGSCCSG